MIFIRHFLLIWACCSLVGRFNQVTVTLITDAVVIYDSSTWSLCCAVFAADLTTPVPGSCAELTCYFGASCEEHHAGRAECVCRSTCADEDSSSSHVVCGNDGQTYGSECQLKLFACRYQKDIVVQALGPCKGYSWCDLFWYFCYP